MLLLKTQGRFAAGPLKGEGMEIIFADNKFEMTKSALNSAVHEYLEKHFFQMGRAPKVASVDAQDWRRNVIVTLAPEEATSE